MTDTRDANTRQIIPWVDTARVLCVFLVILAHVDGWAERTGFAASFYYTVSRVGVPIFFLLSGYLLLSKDEDLSAFFEKRIAKILIPFLVWSIIYDVVVSQSFVETGVTLKAVAGLFIRIIRGPRGGHLWFLYHLIGLYLLVPILRVFVKSAKASELYYYIALWFLVMPILPIVEEFTPIQNGFEIYSTGGYVGYFLLGYFIGRLENSSKLLRWGIGLFVVGFLSSFAVFYFDLPPYDNELVFRSYPSLNIILMSLGAFILMKIMGEKGSTYLGRIPNMVSQSGFGIYLIHLLILDWMAFGWTALGFERQGGNPFFVIPLVAILAFLISWACAYLIGKIPFVRAIV